MKANREKIIQGYVNAGDKALASRKLMFIQHQKAGLIPADLEYSDELYADNIGVPFAEMPSPAIANEYLTNIFNRLAMIDFKYMVGDRAELFNRGLKEMQSTGDTVELQYTQITDTTSYDSTKFVPTVLNGGDLILSQQYRLSSIKTSGANSNPDKRTLSVNVPVMSIMRALIPAITNGLADGWPTYFNNILDRSWEKFKFERFRTLVSMAGATPSTNEWFSPTTTFTKNDAQFVEITTPITDANTFQEFLISLYAKSSEIEGEYNTKYNPAGINQINSLSQQGLFLDSSLETFWRSTNAILFNGKSINPKSIYGDVDFYKMLRSKVDPTLKVKAILYVDYPFRHTPFTENIRRGFQMWEPNQVYGIYDHFWLASAIDLSAPIIIFYEKKEIPKLSDVIKVTNLGAIKIAGNGITFDELESAILIKNPLYVTGGIKLDNSSNTEAEIEGLPEKYTGKITVTYTTTK